LGFSHFDGESTPTHQRVTQAVSPPVAQQISAYYS
jgi:hypothetical protein